MVALRVAVASVSWLPAWLQSPAQAVAQAAHFILTWICQALQPFARRRCLLTSYTARTNIPPLGGFGANNNTNNSTFGSKPFGSSTTGGGLFGGGGGGATGGSTFGGFGASNTNNTSSGFGAGASAGTSLFGGANKPAFGGGATTNTGGGLFGGGSTGGFGSNTTSGGFGSGATGGFGAAGANTTNNGTASTPFQAHTEKDGTSATQHYQTITFQQPYQNFSLEELRLADYNQGRRYGNSNGQGGAFGQGSTFGGFGANNNTSTNTTSAFGSTNTNTGGGLFGGGGSTTNTAGGFGQAAGGFGANNNTNTGGGLFGAKPATGGGLFGGSNTASTGTTGGGLFGGGSTTNTTGGFGSAGGFGAANNTSTGGGLFGNNNTAKPAFGAGATSTPTGFGASSNTGFGQSNTGGGMFGQNNQASAAPGFGAAAPTANSGGGLFGNNSGSAFGQNNNTQTPASGGLFGGSGGFGQNNQAKPATGGLFGGGASTTANTGGGLFGGGGAAAAAPASGGLFGNSTANNNTGGGLFGGAAKPPATGGGLFGGGNTANTGAAAGGGLFGSLGGQNNSANAGSSLFGGQNNQQKPGGLFGSSTANNNAGGGLFGGMSQNNQQQNNLGGSLFGASQNNQQQGQQQNGNSLFGASGSSLLNTSLNTNPYGNDALFAGLATPTQSPGPIATPLSSSQKNKKSAILPQHKLNPAASTRLLTPQAKRTGGYGFSYSTYGSPASGQATPNLGGSLFAGGSLSRSLGSRSTSMSNLRNSFTPETSILAPGAFSTTGRSFGNGGLKKLNVNRSLNTRIPLFDEPSHKRVSFAGGDGDTLNGSANGETAMVVRREDGDASPRSVNGETSPEPSRPALQQVNGNELARVPENDTALTPKSSSEVNAQLGEDPEPGEYWSQPTLQQLKKMSKQELKSVRNFVVGRHNIGQIEFHQGSPVDLSETDIDKLFGDIVQLNHRNATVYGENCTCLPKPPMGTALNHPSRVTLLNSWPRNKAGKKDVKHLERLKRVAGTTFESYNAANGGWIFTVPHFSSYGLDYEKDYSDDEDESSELSPVPDTPAQTLLNTSQMTSTPQQDSLISPDGSSPDDTFDFKRGMRPRASVPGGFSDDTAYEEHYDDEADSRDESFLGERSVGSSDGQHDADQYETESELDQDQSMADSVSGPIHTTEPAAATDFDPFRSTLKAPKSILKASQIFKPNFGTPSKGHAVFDDDWADQLQRTISPRKQDRTALRESQGFALREGSPTFAAQSASAQPFTNHMDILNSLFGETDNHRESLSKRQGQGIEV